jgi:hypothetical protein
MTEIETRKLLLQLAQMLRALVGRAGCAFGRGIPCPPLKLPNAKARNRSRRRFAIGARLSCRTCQSWGK